MEAEICCQSIGQPIDAGGGLASARLPDASAQSRRKAKESDECVDGFGQRAEADPARHKVVEGFD